MQDSFGEHCRRQRDLVGFCKFRPPHFIAMLKHHKARKWGGLGNRESLHLATSLEKLRFVQGSLYSHLGGGRWMIFLAHCFGEFGGFVCLFVCLYLHHPDMCPSQICEIIYLFTHSFLHFHSANSYCTPRRYQTLYMCFHRRQSK